MRIFTGAPIPDGANTVIQQELVSLQHNSILFEQGSVKQGDNVRLRGAMQNWRCYYQSGNCYYSRSCGIAELRGISNIDVP
ncbi:MAG: hypothetical protein IPH46_17800 [Bacteroidetes bacterium]|nr:hypothetical protein [Bacteroidota bacterium]